MAGFVTLNLLGRYDRRQTGILESGVARNVDFHLKFGQNVLGYLEAFPENLIDYVDRYVPMAEYRMFT